LFLIMFQVHTLATRPASMFLNLRHLTYEILLFTKRPNSYSGILQLSQYLAFAPQLETLEVHVSYCVSYLVFAHLSFLLPLLPNSS
jgi:hypothetical protein